MDAANEAYDRIVGLVSVVKDDARVTSCVLRIPLVRCASKTRERRHVG
jgi:hypothetical protein